MNRRRAEAAESFCRPRRTNFGGIMNIRPWKRVVALIAVGAYVLSGCTALQNVPLRHSDRSFAPPEVSVGEPVVVHTKSGEVRKFTVTAVEDDALVGGNTRVAYADMEQLEVRRGDASSGKTGLIIGAVVLGVAAIAAAAGGGGGGGGY